MLARPTTAVVTTQPLLGPLKQSWDELVDANPLPSPFLRSWWLENTSVGRPIFVLVRDDDSLIGGVALQEDRYLGRRRLRFMGAGPLCPDHLDAISHPEREDDVVAALQTWFDAQGPALVDLTGLRADSLVVRSLVVHCVVRDHHAPYLTLEPSFDAVLAKQKSSFRRNVRRRTRRFDERGVRHGVATADGLDAAFEDLRELHRKQWSDSSGLVRSFERFRAAGLAGSRVGEFAIHELSIDHEDRREVVATSVVLRVAGRVSIYQGGRIRSPEWSAAGAVVLAKIAAAACEAGNREMDFLRGAEPYKDDWSNGTRDVLRAIATSRSAGWQDRAFASLVSTGVSTRIRLRPVRHRIEAFVKQCLDRPGRDDQAARLR